MSRFARSWTLAARCLGDRRGRAALAAVGLIGTFLLFEFVPHAAHAGSVVFVPWIALIAVDLGLAAGVAAGLAGLGLFLVTAASHGADITPVFVLGRGASFVLIGAGVGALGTRLRRNEARNWALVEGLPLAVYVESEERGLFYVGPQIESMIGYPRADWLNNNSLWRRVVHPDDRDRVLDEYAHAVASQAPLTYEYRLVGPDGKAIWVRDSSGYIADGQRSYRQGFIVDITQQKKTEEQLARNATLMRGLIDTTVDGIALTDRDGRILIANEPLRRLVHGLGIPSEGPIHERLIAIAGKTTEPERYERRMRELAADPFTTTFDEFELGDNRRVFQGYTAPVIGDHDEYFARVWTLRDVSEQRELENLRDAFVATVSHELRTPLTSMLGFLELIHDQSEELTPQVVDYLEIVRRNASRLETLVGDLLFIAQIEAGRLSLEFAEADIADLAAQAVDAARPAVVAKEVTLMLEARAPSIVIADANRLRQVLDNLVSNAVKFTPSGGTIRVTVEDLGDTCALHVSDTGVGISESEQSRLFERFFRSEAAETRRIPGTGLGLAITKAIVDGHDGSITVESVEGEGSTFTISLPKPTARRRRQTAGGKTAVPIG
ncbi:MAG TPA: ATP-binding protein [Gaiellaceae bacterium]|nr:ATP-binding protein [Gaiellaceae bacterium]